MKKEERYRRVTEYFLEHGEAQVDTELRYATPYELLVAVMLSAQCTDKRVNAVTPALFVAFPTVEALARADAETDVFPYISSVSYPNSKARHLVEMAQKVVNEFDGQIPNSIEGLMSLPGVGRKTANVVMSVAFGAQTLAVDTHVFRVSHRLGLVDPQINTPLKTEQELTKNLPHDLLSRFHFWLLLHGRYICTARKPHCQKCGLAAVCASREKEVKSATSHSAITLLVLAFLLSLATSLPGFAQTAVGRLQTDSLSSILKEYFAHYRAPGYEPTGQPRMESCEIDSASGVLTVNTNDVFGAQPWTDEIVASVYASVKAALPASARKLKLHIYSESRAIETLVPGTYKQNPPASHRLLDKDKGAIAPWTFNVSKPYVFTHGLQGRHVAICSSHGRYFNHAEGRWSWQRPRLFCTTEDLLTQTFVVPFLLPMLERAGAVVYSPRERCWNRNEVVVDNDATSSNSGGRYVEHGSAWQTSPSPGFAYNHGEILYDGENPFTRGTSRMLPARKPGTAGAGAAMWIPKIERTGDYAVYVSYQSGAGAVSDARYTVYHCGIATELKVNQRMGGGTWVYLGTYRFAAGESEKNCVSLSNVSSSSTGGYVYADAVRFGGGMGNVARGEQDDSAAPSGLPRYLEGARYSAQWAGIPYSAYSSYGSTDDYKDDINARSYAINHLAGGSWMLPEAAGEKVPLELSIAVHSDAGYKSSGLVGTLGISTTTGPAGEKSYPSGVSRMTSYDLSTMLIDGVATELSMIYGHRGWPRRESFDKNYSESCRPAVPAMIIETLSHQNFHDMVYAHDPWFKFLLARSIYKGILRYEAYSHNTKYTVAPLPPACFSVEFVGSDEVKLKWRAVVDSLEPTARPTGYIVYTREGDGDFNNGTYVRQTSFRMKLTAGVVYSFRVSAVNSGGESFPSEILAACRRPASGRGGQSRPVMIVNCFNRLSGPATIETADSLGFDISRDIGVPYIETPEYCGRQQKFNPRMGGSEGSEGLGRSSGELEGTMIAGNTFDYAYVHGKAISGSYSFVSCGREAVENGSVNLEKYPMVDLIFGLQRSSAHDFHNFKTFTPALQRKIGAYLAAGGALLASGAYLGSDMTTPSERAFLAQKLHCSMAGQKRGNIGTITGAEERFSVEHELGKAVYAVQAADCLRPIGGAQAVFKYPNGEDAGVLYKGSQSRSITLGFPLESITDRGALARVMTRLTGFLISNQQNIKQ